MRSEYVLPYEPSVPPSSLTRDDVAPEVRRVIREYGLTDREWILHLEGRRRWYHLRIWALPLLILGLAAFFAALKLFEAMIEGNLLLLLSGLGGLPVLTWLGLGFLGASLRQLEGSRKTRQKQRDPLITANQHRLPSVEPVPLQDDEPSEYIEPLHEEV